MKIEHKSWMGMSSVLAALALCAQASAQHAGDVRGNLANDIRDGGSIGRGPVRGFGTVQDAGSMQVPQATQDLGFELTLSVEPYDASNLNALFPGKSDMKKTLRLNGRAFQPVALQISLEEPSAAGRVARGYTIRGEIGADGSFVIELPPDLDTSGLFVQGYSQIDNDFTAVLGLDQAVDEAYLSWTVASTGKPSHGMAKPAKQRLFSWDAERTAKPTHTAKPGRRVPGPGHVVPTR
jgi:hypothetical protein